MDILGITDATPVMASTAKTTFAKKFVFPSFSTVPVRRRPRFKLKLIALILTSISLTFAVDKFNNFRFPSRWWRVILK